jgi:hypothetical protein
MSTDDKPISHQLRYYIALAAPPTRAPVDGSEAFLCAEVGFNLLWFTTYCKGVSFSGRWHEDPDYRFECHSIMSAELRRLTGHLQTCMTVRSEPGMFLTAL